MKRSKTITGLVGVLAVASVLTVCVMHQEKKQEDIENTDEVILEIPTDQVMDISWNTDSDNFEFVRSSAADAESADETDAASADETEAETAAETETEAETEAAAETETEASDEVASGTDADPWVYTSDSAFPVSQDQINSLVGIFNEFGASFVINDVEDYSQYGLDDPEYTITIKTADQTYEVKLGDFSTMDEERYVDIGDGNVYLVTTDPMDSFNVELTSLIQNDSVPDFDQAQTVTFSGDADYSFDYVEENTVTYCDEDFYFTTQDGQQLPLDTELVKTYLDTMKNMTLTNYVTYNATDEDLAEYGLDDPQLTVNVAYTMEDEDGNNAEGTVTLSISRDPDELAAAEKETEAETEDADDTDSSDDSSDITAYARIGDSSIIYQITGSTYETLIAASYNDLRHQRIEWADFSQINKINATIDGETYTITSKGDGDDRKYYYNDEEIVTDDLKSSLSLLTATEFTDEQPSEKEEISLTLYLDSDNVSEVQMSLYRNDGDTCIAEIDGQPVAMVSRSTSMDIVEAINAIVLK